MKFLVFLFMFVGLLFAKVDLNTASEADLQKVKGVGPAKAKAIVEYRQKSGGFKSVDDLKNVKGFSEKSVAALKNDLEVAATPTKK